MALRVRFRKCLFIFARVTLKEHVHACAYVREWDRVCVCVIGQCLTVVVRAAATAALCRPMGAQWRQEGEGAESEADLTPFVMKDLMSGVQIRAANESTRPIRRRAIYKRRKLPLLWTDLGSAGGSGANACCTHSVNRQKSEETIRWFVFQSNTRDMVDFLGPALR